MLASIRPNPLVPFIIVRNVAFLLWFIVLATAIWRVILGPWMSR